jgi:hypothetical protein
MRLAIQQSPWTATDRRHGPEVLTAKEFSRGT